MQNFLNYLASKMILLNYLQSVFAKLFKYIVSHITIIPQNNTFQY